MSSEELAVGSWQSAVGSRQLGVSSWQLAVKSEKRDTGKDIQNAPHPSIPSPEGEGRSWFKRPLTCPDIG